MILRGNHKSFNSELNSSAIYKYKSEDIDHGWSLLLIIEYLQNIKNTEVMPLGDAEQLSINEKGEQYIKFLRPMTIHSQSPQYYRQTTGSNGNHSNHYFMTSAWSVFYTWSQKCEANCQQKRSLSERETWAQPTDGYMQKQKSRRHALQ